MIRTSPAAAAVPGNPAALQVLEPRRLLSAAYPSALEQYAVELINRGRANPAAEAARYGIDLNEGLAAGTISTAARQPLAINPYLVDGARKHSQWMIDTDTFGHTGQGGTTPGDRMKNAGYTFSGTWRWGENVAWHSGNTDAALIASLHEDLFVDAGIAGRGHRTNLMQAEFREIGTGVVAGTFRGWDAGMLTQDFAKSGSSVFLTGVTFKDAGSKDNFYTPGEGLGGVTITATRVTDGARFSTTTWASGGYALAVPAGTYSVMASGGAFSSPAWSRNVAVGSQNVKRDFQPPAVGTTPGDTTAPTASLTRALRVRSAGARYYYFAVTYADNVAVNPATFDNADIVVTGPGGYARAAVFSSANSTAPGTPRVVEYMVKGPGGSWNAADNAVYTISLQPRQVADAAGNAAAARALGQFSCRIPEATATPAVAPTAAPVAAAPPPATPFATGTAADRQPNDLLL